MYHKNIKLRASLFFLTLLFLFQSCKVGEIKDDYPYKRGKIVYESEKAANKNGKLFGDLIIAGKNKTKLNVNVNVYLWRAGIDILTFMGLETADASKGVIETKWYTDFNAPNERTKIKLSIIGKTLTVESMKINMVKELKVSGKWQKRNVSKKTIIKLEDAVLSKAIELKHEDS